MLARLGVLAKEEQDVVGRFGPHLVSQSKCSHGKRVCFPRPCGRTLACGRRLGCFSTTLECGAPRTASDAHTPAAPLWAVCGGRGLAWSGCGPLALEPLLAPLALAPWNLLALSAPLSLLALLARDVEVLLARKLRA